MTNSDNYAIDFAAPSTGDAVGLSIMQKQKESGKENLSILVGITHAFFATADITEVSEKYFTRTDDDIPYARWEFVINSNDGKSHNVIYMFDADDWQLVVFYTRPSNQGEENDILVDEAMKTLCYGNEQTLATTPTSIAKSETSEIAMVLIPAGTFEMGSDTDKALAECEKLRTQSGDCQAVWFSAESPIHKVTLNTFYMDVYEVTNAFYSECVRAGKCNAPTNSCPNNCTNYYGNPQYANYPVTWVSWEDANDYCTWRDARLPSEAEWEYAARGGLSGKNYPWGDTFDGKSLNFCDTNCAEDWKNTDYDDGFADISPVGNYAPNDYGLFDMVGNAYEWVADWFDVYPGGDSRVRDDYGQMYRVLRGGSFFDSGYYQRVSNRFRWAPSEKYSNFGFRCAQTP
jgi:formylglycine-generating enzyme required for sulfatase activity